LVLDWYSATLLGGAEIEFKGVGLNSIIQIKDLIVDVWCFDMAMFHSDWNILLSVYPA
jgi:hypothetical protein